MIIELELTEGEAMELEHHLEKSQASYANMASDADRSGDRQAYHDFRAREETAVDLRQKVIAALKEAEQYAKQ